jgi:hypothetical protein
MSHRKPRTVVRKPHLDRMCKRWNQQQLEALYRLESTGAPLADLAVITGRTEQAIRQQLADHEEKAELLDVLHGRRRNHRGVAAG